jgi:hypothetical protein
MVRSNRNSKSRRNKRGGNYPDTLMEQQSASASQSPMTSQSDYSQAPMMPQQSAYASQAPMMSQQSAYASQTPMAPQQESSSGFFSNLFGSSAPAAATGASEAEKPWYKIWGGRRRNKSRKSRKGRKTRKTRYYKK